MKFLKPIICTFILLGSVSHTSWSVASAEDPPLCKAHAEFPVADFHYSTLDNGKLNGKDGYAALKALGIKTVFRYYDQRNETLGCKTLTPGETDALIENGFSIAVVFQHKSPDPEQYFDKGSGTKAAKRALELARVNGQPEGSAIYFGVDGADQRIASGAWWYFLAKGKDLIEGNEGYKRIRGSKTDKEMETLIKQYNAYRRYAPVRFKDKNGTPLNPGKVKAKHFMPYVGTYFDEINAEFAKVKDSKGRPRYRIGVYGSGLTCGHLLGSNPVKPASLKPGSRVRGENAKIDFCWLSLSRRWPGSQEFAKTDKWMLHQQSTTKCTAWKRKSGEVAKLDFNRIQAGAKDFGQWSKVENRDLTGYLPPIKKKWDGVVAGCYKFQK